jgi:hypothetical protein
MTSEEVRKQILPSGATPFKYARVSQLTRPAGPFGRAWLYEGITQGRFRSIVIRKSGCSRGLRLIDLESLHAFLEREAEPMHSPLESLDPGKEEKGRIETCRKHLRESSE